MPESEMIITSNDEENLNHTNDRDSSTSPNSTKNKRTRLTFPFGACRVCSDSATGIHYGIATCEGCKGFFKRSILRKEKYRCYFDNSCLINVTNRNRCKACRFRRCIDEGMSVDGVKMGRIPKLVKERALKELKELQMKEETASSETNEAHPRTGSCSSVSDRSIENYDPNTMETDFVQRETSPIQRNSELTNRYTDDNLKKSNPINSSDIQQEGETTVTYRTKYPTFLLNDTIINDNENSIDELSGLLNDESMEKIQSITNKFNAKQSNISAELNEDEITLIRYLRWCSFNVYLRRSKRVKQLVSRMNKMIENNIHEYPGDDATFGELISSIRLSCEIVTPATVKHIQELPGFKNLQTDSLQKILSQRAFGWSMIIEHELYNNNGESYNLAPNGFQYTRKWMEKFNTNEFVEGTFHFSHCLQKLHLSESELSLILAVYMCYQDPAMSDNELIIMLRGCYLHALYSELCHNRGENEGQMTYNKTLQTLELLNPLVELFQRETASRILEI